MSKSLPSADVCPRIILNTHRFSANFSIEALEKLTAIICDSTPRIFVAQKFRPFAPHLHTLQLALAVAETFADATSYLTTTVVCAKFGVQSLFKLFDANGACIGTSTPLLIDIWPHDAQRNCDELHKHKFRLGSLLASDACNALTLRCELEIYEETAHGDGDDCGGSGGGDDDWREFLPTNDAHLEQLVDDLRSLNSDPTLADCEIVAHESTFLASSALLRSRSRVLRAMLDDERRVEQLCGGRRRIVVHGFSAPIIEQLLAYIHTGRIEAAAAAIADFDLLVAAERFALPRLQQLAARRVRRALSLESVLKILRRAELQDSPALRQCCLVYMRANRRLLMQSEQWAALANRKKLELTIAFLDNDDDK